MEDDADGGFNAADVWNMRSLSLEAIDRILDAPNVPYFQSMVERQAARTIVVLLERLAQISLRRGRQASQAERDRIQEAYDELLQAIDATVDTRERLPDLAPMEALWAWITSWPEREHGNVNVVEKFTFPLMLSFYEGIYGLKPGKSPTGRAARFVQRFDQELATMLRSATCWDAEGKVVPCEVWPEPSADNIASRIRKHVAEAAAMGLGPRLRAKFVRQIEADQGPTRH